MRTRVAVGVGAAVVALAGLGIGSLVNGNSSGSSADPSTDTSVISAPVTGRVGVAGEAGEPTPTVTSTPETPLTPASTTFTSERPTTTTPSTTTTSTTTTSTTTPSTTTPSTTTTTSSVPAPVSATPDGAEISSQVAHLANNLRQAAARGDLRSVGLLIPVKGFRTTFIEDGKDVVEAWALQSGTPLDPLPRIVRALGLPPGIDAKGRIVYPYFAVIEPSEWSPTEDRLAMDVFGWSTELLDAAKQKNRYLDDRVVFSPTADWVEFTNGPEEQG